MIHIRIKEFTPNRQGVVIDTVLPAPGLSRYRIYDSGYSGSITMEVIVDSEEDLPKRAKEICDKLAELDFCRVERPWIQR